MLDKTNKVFFIFAVLYHFSCMFSFFALILDFQNGGRPPSWIWYDHSIHTYTVVRLCLKSVTADRYVCCGTV